MSTDKKQKAGVNESSLQSVAAVLPNRVCARRSKACAPQKLNACEVRFFLGIANGLGEMMTCRPRRAQEAPDHTPSLASKSSTVVPSQYI